MPVQVLLVLKGCWVSDSIVLICAVLAAMASGVLLAYGVCLAFFRAVKMGAARQVAAPATAVVAQQMVQG